VRCPRLNNRQSNGLNDEKIICQPQPKLIRKMPGLAPGIFVFEAYQKVRGNSGL
jgi:hypothetical protein